MIAVDDRENSSDEEHVAANRFGDIDDLVNSEQYEGNKINRADKTEKIHNKSGVCDERIGRTRKVG